MRYPPAPTLPKPKHKPPSGRLGVWLFGAYGGLATTLVVGTRALARGLAQPTGLATELPVAAGIPWQPLDGIVFGGHEIRRGDYATSAAEIHGVTGSLAPELVAKLKKDLAAASRNVVQGVMPNPGRTIASLADRPARRATLRQQVAAIERDLRAFMRKNRLDRVVCVNLTSTEPPLQASPAHRTLAAFEKALAKDDQKAVRPSALYAYVAAKLGLPFVHFTPSESALLPAIREAFAATKTPWMGRDGKTGETLVKSALAPMLLIASMMVCRLALAGHLNIVPEPWSTLTRDCGVTCVVPLMINDPGRKIFQQMLFSKIVPNCKKLGLLERNDKWLRHRFEEMGVIQFEDWENTGEEYLQFELGKDAPPPVPH